ncbi:Chorion transcription factor Cf2, partial [Stegodyphus mimosarum]
MLVVDALKVRGTKQFVHCPYCSYSTSVKGRLRDHMLTHTGERPHSCPYCGRRFAQKSSMRRHAMRHCI